MGFDLLSIILFTSDIRIHVAHKNEDWFYAVSLILSAAAAISVYIFSYTWYRDLRRYESTLRTFSLDNAKCSDPKDRKLLLSDIDERFGGVELFEKYVQTELLSEIGTNRPKLKYLWFLSLPTLLATTAYIVILPQRLGLYCMAEFELKFVAKDFGMCAVIDRDLTLNYGVIASQIIRFLCYYPVIVQIVLLLCEFSQKISEKQTTSRKQFLEWSIHAVGVTVIAILIYWENKGHGSENLALYQITSSSILCGMFLFLYVGPHAWKRFKTALHSKTQ